MMLNIFHVLLSDSCVSFGDMSVQILRSFLKWAVIFFILLFILDKTFISCKICEYFFPSLLFASLFLIDVFWSIELLILLKSNLLIFLWIMHFISKNNVKSIVIGFVLILLYKNFIGLAFKFTSIIYFLVA